MNVVRPFGQVEPCSLRYDIWLKYYCLLLLSLMTLRDEEEDSTFHFVINECSYDHLLFCVADTDYRDPPVAVFC